ncbi:hypothetical protein GCM10027093_04450 [Paraburkholderia jirisanensis]
MNCRVTCIEFEVEQLNVRQIAALRLLNEQLANAEQWIRTWTPDLRDPSATDSPPQSAHHARVLCLRREPLLDCADQQRDVVAILDVGDASGGSDATGASADVDESGMSFFSHGLFHDVPVCRLFCELVMRACGGKLANVLAIGSLVIEIDEERKRELVWTNLLSYIPGRSRG